MVRLTERKFDSKRNGWFDGSYDRVIIGCRIKSSFLGRGGFGNLFCGLHLSIEVDGVNHYYYLGNYNDIERLKNKAKIRRCSRLENTMVDVYKKGPMSINGIKISNSV